MQIHVRLLFFMAILCDLADSQASDLSDIFRDTNNKSKIYCGKNLSATLSAVCHGHYNTLNKKSTIYEKRAYWESQYGEDPEYPFKSKRSAVAITGRRRKRGVFNECCQKPCSYEELTSYCGSTRPRRFV